MSATQSVLALRPGAKLSKSDRAALAAVGITVVRVDPKDLVAIQSVDVLPLNAMLRAALDAIKAANFDSVRTDFAKRMIEACAKFGATP